MFTSLNTAFRAYTRSFSSILTARQANELYLASPETVKFVDSSWSLSTSLEDYERSFRQKRLPQATFLSIDDVSEKETDLPHMIPEHVSTFETAMRELGISENDHVIVYGQPGKKE